MNLLLDKLPSLLDSNFWVDFPTEGVPQGCVIALRHTDSCNSENDTITMVCANVSGDNIDMRTADFVENLVKVMLKDGNITNFAGGNLFLVDEKCLLEYSLCEEGLGDCIDHFKSNDGGDDPVQVPVLKGIKSYSSVVAGL